MYRGSIKPVSGSVVACVCKINKNNLIIGLAPCADRTGCTVYPTPASYARESYDVTVHMNLQWYRLLRCVAIPHFSFVVRWKKLVIIHCRWPSVSCLVFESLARRNHLRLLVVDEFSRVSRFLSQRYRSSKCSIVWLV